MKFTVERDVLADGVAWVSRALPLRPPVPVLAGVLIEATATGVKLSSFDYEVSARGELDATVEQEGTALVSGRLLKEISQALPHKPVHFSHEGSKVHVTCGASRFTLATMPADQYPELPVLPDPSGVVDGAEFDQAVAQVSVAASKDETLPVLTGVRMEIEGDKISLLATDRYRLALREVSWNPRATDISAITLLRAKTLSDTAKALGSAEVTLSLSTESDVNLVGFSSGGRVSTSLLMDGDYPEVRRLFPEESTSTAIVDTTELVEATRRVALVAERNSSVRLAFSEGQVTLDAGHSEDAQASEALEATLQGEDITVAFNPQYLLDGLNALRAPFVRFGFTHDTKPVEFVGLAEADAPVDSGFRYLLVPIRIAS